MYRQVFSVRGEVLGEGLRESYYIKGEEQIPWSIAFFCPVCGDVWAKATVEGSRYHIYAHLCDKHPSRSPAWVQSVPGSIIVPLDAEYWNALPYAVLWRECQLLFEHVLRNGE